MTQKLHALHAEAAAAHARVQALAYDPLDTTETGFVLDCATYNSAMQELECRLAAIVSQVHTPPKRHLFTSCKQERTSAMHQDYVLEQCRKNQMPTPGRCDPSHNSE